MNREDIFYVKDGGEIVATLQKKDNGILIKSKLDIDIFESSGDQGVYQKYIINKLKDEVEKFKDKIYVSDAYSGYNRDEIRRAVDPEKDFDTYCKLYVDYYKGMFKFDSNKKKEMEDKFTEDFYNFTKGIGEHIKKILKEGDISKRELSIGSDIGVHTIEQILSGEENLDVKTIIKIESFLGEKLIKVL